MSLPPSTESTADHSIFEGLFERVLKVPAGPFRERLKQVGFDLDHKQMRYPTSVWRACLEVARQELYPNQPRELGMRTLGRRFIDGFYATITGRMIRVTLPILGNDRVLERFGKQYATARTGVRVDAKKQAHGHWIIDIHDAYGAPDFVAGLMEGASKFTGTPTTVTVTQRREDGFRVEARWQ